MCLCFENGWLDVGVVIAMCLCFENGRLDVGVALEKERLTCHIHAALPLPKELEHLQRAFEVLSVTYQFLRNNLTVVTWTHLRRCLEMTGDVALAPQDVLHMACLCPGVVMLQVRALTGSAEELVEAAASQPLFQSSSGHTKEAEGEERVERVVELRIPPNGRGAGMVPTGEDHVALCSAVYDAWSAGSSDWTPSAEQRDICSQNPIIAERGCVVGGRDGGKSSRRDKNLERRRTAFRAGLVEATAGEQRIFLEQQLPEPEPELRKEDWWHPAFPLEEVCRGALVERACLEARRAASAEAGAAPRRPARPPRQSREPATFACDSTEEMAVTGFVEHLRSGLGRRGQVVHSETLPARDAQLGALTHTLSPGLHDALGRLGVDPRGLFKHQVCAIDAVLEGKNVVVATSTASGKSVCYNVPVLERLLRDPEACAIYVFPTKASSRMASPPHAAPHNPIRRAGGGKEAQALAQDQLRSLRVLIGSRLPSLPLHQV
eukprot:gene22478-27126_t